jgi:hypothetical protein
MIHKLTYNIIALYCDITLECTDMIADAKIATFAP